MNIKEDAVILQVGKNGINANIINEIIKNIRKGKQVRIRMNKGFLDSNNRKDASKELLKMIPEGININISTQLIGNVLVLEKKIVKKNAEH